MQESIAATERQIAKAKMYEEMLKHLESAIIMYNTYTDKTWDLPDGSFPIRATWIPTRQMVQDSQARHERLHPRPERFLITSV
jgi:hypothetical protein